MDNILDENVGNEWTRSGIIYENLCLEVLTKHVKGSWRTIRTRSLWSHVQPYHILWYHVHPQRKLYVCPCDDICSSFSSIFQDLSLLQKAKSMCNNAKVHLSINNRSENRILQCCLNNRRYTDRPTWSRMNA